MRIRCGLLCLALFFSAATAPLAMAQLFSDDAAREQARKNNNDIESLKAVVREMNQSIIQLEKARQQTTLLTQKNQALEQRLRALAGKIEELERALTLAGGKKSASERAERAKQEKLIATMQEKLATLQEHVQDLRNFVTLPPEDDMYNSAYAEYQKNNLDEAIAGFNRVLAYYPDGQFSANCHYWLGQAQLAQKNHAAAHDNATLLLESYPQSDKTPAAMLILARSLQGLGRADEAQLQLKTLIADYPTSLAADSARQLLVQ